MWLQSSEAASVSPAPSEPQAREPHRLLQYLCEIQRLHSHIPAPAIDELSESLDIPAAQIRGLVDFYSFLHLEPRGAFDIRLSDSITDRMLGNRGLFRRLCDRLGVKAGRPRPDGRVTVDLTSCTGLCDQGPALLVNGLAIPGLNADRIDTIAALIERGQTLCAWPSELFRIEDNICRRDLLLGEEWGPPGAALAALLSQGADSVLAELVASGLNGRGGAGFDTATKWRLGRSAPAHERYVVCNAHEGEPGTFKDRVLLTSYANRMFEGMTLCAGVVGARRGYLYLRGEYLYLRPHLEQVLERRRHDGLLGHSILGRAGFDFDIEIRMGAGAYICGEESALLESLEGRRGVPRKRPPFPVTRGLFQQPTVVNNVETFVAATCIAMGGAAGFAARGTEQSTGTRLLSISGDCAQPGVYEYPFGIAIEQILADCGGEDAQAVQVAGAAGRTLPRSEFHRRIAGEDVPTGGSFMVFGPERDMLEMVRNFAAFFVHESCGFCTPCRVGTRLLRDLVEKVHAGHATEFDLEQMREIASVMHTASHCGLGHTAPNPILDTLDKLPQIYRSRLSSAAYEPGFDLDAALDEARRLTSRDDRRAHLKPGS
jgi:[NiFe] hydrogenase diaphorase moiety large subunit